MRNVYVYRLPNRSDRHPRPTSRDDLINARLIVIYPDYHNRVYKPSHRLIIINLPCRRKRHGIIATVALLINARFVLEEEEEWRQQATRSLADLFAICYLSKLLVKIITRGGCCLRPLTPGGGKRYGEDSAGWHRPQRSCVIIARVPSSPSCAQHGITFPGFLNRRAINSAPVEPAREPRLFRARRGMHEATDVRSRGERPLGVHSPAFLELNGKESKTRALRLEGLTNIWVGRV